MTILKSDFPHRTRKTYSKMYQLRSEHESASASILCRNDDHIPEQVRVQVQHGTCTPDTKSYALDDFPKIKKLIMKNGRWQIVGFLILFFVSKLIGLQMCNTVLLSTSELRSLQNIFPVKCT